jgi:hypothetical protein
MSHVQEVVIDTKHQHIEADLKALFRPGDDPVRRTVMREATRLVLVNLNPKAGRSHRGRRKRPTP